MDSFTFHDFLVFILIYVLLIFYATAVFVNQGIKKQEYTTFKKQFLFLFSKKEIIRDQIFIAIIIYSVFDIVWERLST